MPSLLCTLNLYSFFCKLCSRSAYASRSDLAKKSDIVKDTQILIKDKQYLRKYTEGFYKVLKGF